ncbi:MAG: DUF2279 domain-containing protein [Bacteroidetes bacterium]|nr:DUF2279 domain-containing protein [Bacteroidota bacterium]MBS1932193.1 DUF2279 domain-containing protein [Bacteroidota bacterium]
MKKNKKLVIWLTLFSVLFFSSHFCSAQAKTGKDLLNTSSSFQPSRFHIAIIGEAAVATVMTIGLQLLWYKKYPRSRFHFFNDDREWMKMDKLGHATTAYNIAAIQYNLMRWSGVNNNSAILIGGLTGLGYLTMIEIMDGFSSQWGFSPGDMAANTFGAGLFMLQQYAWNEQKIQMRFSFHPSIYAKYNPAELGNNFLQRILKDYNGQSYWLSFNARSFIPTAHFIPRWVNLDFGYSAEGMTGAVTNPGEINGKKIPEFKRQNKFMFGVGAAWAKEGSIPFPGWINILRMPTPVLIWNTNRGKPKLKLFYF